MLFHEIQRLDEINMSPTSLRQLASGINGALVGLEFELVCTPKGLTSELVPDFSEDRRAESIDDIIEFFSANEVNSTSALRNFENKLRKEYEERILSLMADEWEDVKEEYITDKYKEEGFEDDELEGAVADALSDTRLLRQFGREWMTENEDNFKDMYPEDELFAYEGVEMMSNIQNMYAQWIDWPYTTSVSNFWDSPDAVEAVSDSFASVVGKKVSAVGSYHGAARHRAGDSHYILEPDSSIEPNNTDNAGAGAEFVSPPMPLAEAIKDLDAVAAWCKAGNAYTNQSTGLHMNISLPGYDVKNIDYVKLVLLLGDNHVLGSFDRLGNHFAASAATALQKNVRQNPATAVEMLVQMRSQMNMAASKTIHSGVTTKYSSIHVKSNRIEFRSPGGDWLTNYKSGLLQQTLYRFVVAMDAAMHHEKYKNEYYKKLYALLNPAFKNDDIIRYFSMFSAGDLTKQGLTDSLTQYYTWHTRRIQKPTNQSSQL